MHQMSRTPVCLNYWGQQHLHHLGPSYYKGHLGSCQNHFHFAVWPLSKSLYPLWSQILALSGSLKYPQACILNVYKDHSFFFGMPPGTADVFSTLQWPEAPPPQHPG